MASCDFTAEESESVGLSILLCNCSMDNYDFLEHAFNVQVSWCVASGTWHVISLLLVETVQDCLKAHFPDREDDESDSVSEVSILSAAVFLFPTIMKSTQRPPMAHVSSVFA